MSASCSARSGATQEFEPLLAAVAAGLVIENLAVAQGDTLRAAVQRGAPPVLVVFFAAVGASLRLDAFATIGYVALVLSALRIAIIRSSLGFGWRLAGLDQRIGKYAWTGLVSQSGITLGFASVVATEFPGWGPQIQLLLVASIAINEIVGPIVFRQGLARAHEIDADVPRPLMVVSNREPYLHSRTEDGQIVATPATGGVAIALDALMRERGGVWIAHGAGTADAAVVDDKAHVRVPPASPSYTLRRLWLEEPTFSAYYGGFANEGLWPLCHVVDVRPKFRAEDWSAYQDVNRRFAAAVHGELGTHGCSRLHPGLPSRARRAGAAGACAPTHERLCSGTFPGHTLTGFASAPGARICSWACSATTCWRSRSSAIVTTSCRAVEDELQADVETESSRVYFRRAVDARSCRCRLASTTTGSR